MLDISNNGIQSEAEVEPLSYYGIFRAQNEFSEGQQGLGFISTLVERNFKDEWLRDEINKSAFTFGLDGWTFLDESKTWVDCWLDRWESCYRNKSTDDKSSGKFQTLFSKTGCKLR